MRATAVPTTHNSRALPPLAVGAVRARASSSSPRAVVVVVRASSKMTPTRSRARASDAATRAEDGRVARKTRFARARDGAVTTRARGGWDYDDRVELDLPRESALAEDDKLAVAPGGRVESDDLNAELREKTLKAIEKAQYRATVGDVSSISGASVFETQKALNALAADTGATLEVSSAGDLTYVFPRSTRGILSSKSFKMKIEPIVSGAKSLASYVFRVAFGTSLVASVMIVYTAIFALMSAKSSDDRSDRRGGGFAGPRFYISPFDLFWYWDPYYYRRPRRRDREMNFFEAVFSFVFGDGDPNLDFEKRRWELVGRLIQKNKGVVTAEQLAPFLDTAGYEDESFVLPALTRFEGTPEVNTVTGSIIYRFPNMESTAGKTTARSRGESEALAQEERWVFSLAEPSQKIQAGLLGVANLVGVVILAQMINDPQIMYRTREYVELARAFSGLLPGLLSYGVLFFVVPLLRYFRNQGKNREIDARNNSRLLAARRIASPEPRLAAKLAAASSAASQRVVGDAVYTSNEGAGDDYDLSDFDRRLRERS